MLSNLTIKCQVSFFYGRLAFLPCLFGPTLQTMKVSVFIGIFVHVYRRWKFWTFWPLWLRIPMVKVTWFGVCLWATSGIPLPHARVRVPRKQFLAPCCANRSSYSRRQLLACDWKYAYIRTPVEKVLSVCMQFAICCKAHLSRGGSKGCDRPLVTYEINSIHYNFVQFGKQHSRLGCALWNI